MKVKQNSKSQRNDERSQKQSVVLQRLLKEVESSRNERIASWRRDWGRRR